MSTRPALDFPPATARLDPEHASWLSHLCACGHERRYHFGERDGPCIMHATSTARTQQGKILDGTVCPCSRFTRA